MYRKLIYAVAALAVTCVVSCKKDMMVAEDTSSDSGVTELTVGINRSLTKSTTITDGDEVKINSLQVFVFRDDALDAYASVENLSEVTLSCTKGERTVYALVNAPDMSHISSKKALLATRTSLSNYPEYGFEMIGSKDPYSP